MESKSIPPWLRLPKAGQRCFISGLSRTGLCELAVPSEMNDFTPPVKSVLLRKRGAARGVRLVETASLLTYLDGLAAEQRKVGLTTSAILPAAEPAK